MRIEHVESSGVGESPALGSRISLRVHASLGTLTPDDVDVQVLHGRVAADDVLHHPSIASLAHAEESEAGRHLFEAEVALAKTGPFGYTVRICPKNDLLASSADLGLVVWPPDLNTVAPATGRRGRCAVSDRPLVPARRQRGETASNRANVWSSSCTVLPGLSGSGAGSASVRTTSR